MLLIQTISQTDVPSKFIQASWIDFVVELNNRLRAIQASGLHIGLRKVIQYLDKVNASNELGGLVVELVTLSNVVPKESQANRLRREREGQFETNSTEYDEERALFNPADISTNRNSAIGEEDALKNESMSVHSLRYQSFSENIRLSMDSTNGSERLSVNNGKCSNSIDQSEQTFARNRVSTLPAIEEDRRSSVTESIGDGRQPQKSSPTTIHLENVSTAESWNGMGDRTRNSATLTTFPFSRDTIQSNQPGILPLFWK